MLQAELRVRRWQRTGRQTVVTHNAELTPAQTRAVAVLEVGPRAALDGITGLQHDGVEVDGDGWLHIIAPKGSSPKHPPGVRVHESRRFEEADVVERHGVRVVRPAVAAVHAALWARSDREAKFMIILVVQQRRATAEQVGTTIDGVRRSRRRALMRAVIGDVTQGVRAIGELDFAQALRRRGLPAPSRQVLRCRPSGQQYLDCRFDRFTLAVEVDGVQHDAAEHRVADLLRDLTLISEGDSVVRLPLFALRLDETRVMAALEAVFVSRGWRRAA
jgi:very-short-patch-repair endonuclease